MIEILILVFAAGVFTRIADLVADDNLQIGYFGYIAGAAYGLMVAYSMIYESLLSEIVLAILIALLLTKKIDHPVHYTGVSFFILFIAFFGIPAVNMALLVLFILVGIIEETLNNLSDKRKLRGFIGKLFGYRLGMDITTFFVSALTGNWIIFLAMISYDIGYTLLFTGSVRRKLIKFSGQ